MTKCHAKRVGRNQVTNCYSAAESLLCVPPLWMTPPGSEGLSGCIRGHAWELVGCSSAFPTPRFAVPVTSDVWGRMELHDILAWTLGDEHLKDFPMMTLNCHKDIHLLPPPQKCYMGLHGTREGEALRAQGPSYFLILQHTVKTQTNQELTQRCWTQQQRWKSLYQHLYPLGHLVSFSNLLVPSTNSPFLSPTGWW